MGKDSSSNRSIQDYPTRLGERSIIHLPENRVIGLYVNKFVKQLQTTFYYNRENYQSCD